MSYRILVIDDEEAILFAMKEYFTTQGFDVDVAADVVEAKARLAAGRYALVLLDLRLDGSDGADGLEVVKHIRERWPGTRIVVLTAYGTPEVERRSAELGVDSFLHKPKPLADVAQLVFGILEITPATAGSTNSQPIKRREEKNAGKKGSG